MVKRSDNPGQSGRAFESASIILPVINETHSLLKTVEVIEDDCTSDVKEYLIVVCNKTTLESIKICEQLHDKDPKRFVLHYQKLPFLGGAIREAFDLAQGSHVIMMASDLETDPNDVKQLMAMAKEKPSAIITASRWLESGSFTDYNKLKLILNFLFQKFFSLIFATHLSDMTYGYRIFPTRLVKSIIWKELRHPFLFETLLKPLQLGVRVYEIPSRWSARVEGESQNTFMRNFAYFKTGLYVRFCPKDKILKPLAQQERV
jgi:glycosyltransferase involved in cell wall biosynthesis